MTYSVRDRKYLLLFLSIASWLSHRITVHHNTILLYSINIPISDKKIWAKVAHCRWFINVWICPRYGSYFNVRKGSDDWCIVVGWKLSIHSTAKKIVRDLFPLLGDKLVHFLKKKRERDPKLAVSFLFFKIVHRIRYIMKRLGGIVRYVKSGFSLQFFDS